MATKRARSTIRKVPSPSPTEANCRKIRESRPLARTAERPCVAQAGARQRVPAKIEPVEAIRGGRVPPHGHGHMVTAVGRLSHSTAHRRVRPIGADQHLRAIGSVNDDAARILVYFAHGMLAVDRPGLASSEHKPMIELSPRDHIPGIQCRSSRVGISSNQPEPKHPFVRAEQFRETQADDFAGGFRAHPVAAHFVPAQRCPIKDQYPGGRPSA